MIDERRRFFLRQGLLGLVVLPLGAGMLARRPAAQELPYLDPEREEARALGYVENAREADGHPGYSAGETCRNCLFFEANTQGCQIFPQYRVTPDGWCQSWAPAD
ncbi:high-potential iron-sulfur protein [Billgrantia gudaonensis]|uniref:High-potential iron-sulfur protein n=1 Tax=Billgrantia gudaonensis TaxID=376427 RepID=A0A1G8U9A1_9GAMM|nr:high-potential iron-sulfur protein [Halomonas gudaonensis]SDJ50386.1 High potential iron-sulfur protein [Halomonas gudaonensis]